RVSQACGIGVRLVLAGERQGPGAALLAQLLRADLLTEAWIAATDAAAEGAATKETRRRPRRCGRTGTRPRSVTSDQPHSPVATTSAANWQKLASTAANRPSGPAGAHVAYAT